jgi:beta-hydroxyacyl-ACP dehydratase FabZ
MIKEVGIKEILTLLPHRYPFLLIDRAEIINESKAIGYKNVTVNEPFFQGHFPGNPIMPGVLILEAMAQTGAVLLFTVIGEKPNKLIYFMGMDKVKFRQPVLPGDQIRFEIIMLRFQGKVGRMQGKAYVGDKLVAEAIQSSIVVDRE